MTKLVFYASKYSYKQYIIYKYAIYNYNIQAKDQYVTKIPIQSNMKQRKRILQNCQLNVYFPVFTCSWAQGLPLSVII